MIRIPAPDRALAGATRSLAFVLAGLLAGGCYNYAPLTTVPQPGVTLVAELTDSGTAVLARDLGPNAATLEGDLIALDTAHVELAVLAVKDRAGIEHFWKGERVTIARPLVARLCRRQFAPARSAVIAAGTVAAAVGLLDAFGVVGFGAGSGGGPSSGK